MANSIEVIHHSGQKVTIHITPALEEMDEFVIMEKIQKLIDELEHTTDPKPDYSLCCTKKNISASKNG